MTFTLTLTMDSSIIFSKVYGLGSIMTVNHFTKGFTISFCLGEKDATEENKSTHKSKSNGHSGRNHAMRRKRSMSNASDSGVVLRRDVRELAKFFALWLESKETSSSDDESILDSMSQELDDDESEDSGNELRNLHRRLLSDDESKDSPIMDGDNSSDIVSVATEDEQYTLLSPKKCKKVTFNLTPMDDKDEDATIPNEEDHVSYSKKVTVNTSSPLVACLNNNPLSKCNAFDFPEYEGEEEGQAQELDDEEIIEEVEEIIEEEEEVVEEIIEEEVVNVNGENYNPDDESVTIVEEKEEVIDEVVECIKVTC